jgi:hypothetical protein
MKYKRRRCWERLTEMIFDKRDEIYLGYGFLAKAMF